MENYAKQEERRWGKGGREAARWWGMGSGEAGKGALTWGTPVSWHGGSGRDRSFP